MLDHHRDGDPRGIGGREGDEQRVVAQLGRHGLGVVFLVLADRVHLRGAGLAGDHVRALPADRARGALLATRHAHHGVDHVTPVRRLRQLHPPDRGLGRLGGAVGTGGAQEQVRAHRLAAIAEHRRGRGELHRRDLHVALADAVDQGLARVPGLAARAALPLGVRDQAVALARQVDARLGVEAEAAQEFRHRAHAQAQRQVVEHHVAGLGDRVGEIDLAVGLPVAVAAAAAVQAVIAPALDGLAALAGPGLEPVQRDERLDGRARRVLAADRAIEQRPVRRVAQLGVAFAADAVDEGIGVIGGRARQRQDLAIARIEHHRRPVALAEQLLGAALQLEIEAQEDVPAGHRRLLVEHAQQPALGVDLDAAHARAAVQQRLVLVLDAELAGVGGRAVGAGIQALEVVLVDAPDIAQRMHGERPVRVAAGQAGDDVDPGEPVAVDRHAGDLFRRQAEPQRDAFERARAVPGRAQALDVLRLVGDQVGQRRERGVEILHPLGHQLQAEARQVLCQHPAVAVTDQPARGGDRLQAHAVVVGQRGEVIEA